MKSKQWYKKNTFHNSEFEDISLLVKKKNALGYKISVGIPTLNEEETIGDEISIIRNILMDKYKLVDEIIVIDSGSKDKTKEEAEKAGALFYYSDKILPEEQSIYGKGENLWKSLYVLNGDIIVWLDADIKNISPKFVYGLVGPLLDPDNGIGYVKAFYDRPVSEGEKLLPSGGGRVTEILIRPLLSLYYPELAYIMQPLSGEYAGKREVLEKLSFPIGYGVEISHLLDLYMKYGLDVMAQVDLDLRIHRNRTIHELGKMSFGILQSFFNRALEHGIIKSQKDLNLNMIQFEPYKRSRIPKEEYYKEIKRPPINSLESYNRKNKNYNR